ELSRGLNAQHYPMPDPWEATAAQHMKLLPDLFDMARQYSENGKPAKAVEILLEALKFHPDDTGVMNHLAVAYNRSGQPKLARDLLLKVILKNGKNLAAHIALSATSLELGSLEDALQCASRAVELGTNSTEAYLAKANALLAMERDD